MDDRDKEAIRAIGLGPDNAGPTKPAAFNPDWDQLEACRDSLREYMQICAEYRAALEGVLGMARMEAERSPTWANAVSLIEKILEAK